MKLTSFRTLQTFVLFLLVVGLLALALGGFLSPLSRIFLYPVVSAQTWVSTRFQALQDFISSPSDVNSLRQRNAELESEVARLQTQIIQLQSDIKDFEVLTALLDFARAHPENTFVSAAVIGRDPSPFIQFVYINRGSDDGLRRGMPVVTDQGLVGRVAAVTASAARVQLITDPSSNINVRLEPSQTEAVVVGQITGEITLDMIPIAAVVQPGDLVLTSGYGGNYPADILIGQISGVRKRDYELFQTASVQPAVDFTQLGIVMVLTNFRPVDLTPLQP